MFEGPPLFVRGKEIPQGGVNFTWFEVYNIFAT